MQCPCESDQSLPAQLLSQTRIACRKHYQVRIPTDLLEDFPGLQQSVFLPVRRFFRNSQHQRRVERKSLIQQSVRGEMYIRNRRTERLRPVLRSLCAEVCPAALGIEGGNA